MVLLAELLGAQRGGERVVGHPEIAEDAVDEERQIGGALAQRGQPDLDDREPVEQIGAEALRVDLGAEIAIGRGDDADVDRQVVVAADTTDLAALERAQELGLEREAELADLVEQDGATVRGLKHADAALVCAGERAPLVTEQLGLEEIRRHGTAIDDEERLLGARAAAVHRLGRDLLPGAGLAFEQHGGIGRRDAGELRHRSARGGSDAEHAAESIGGGERDLGVIGLEAERQARGADRDRGPVAQWRLEHRDRVDRGAVAATQVLEDHGLGLDAELAVEARHRAVGEPQIGGLVGPHDDPVPRRHQRLPDVRPGLDGEPEPADQHAVAVLRPQRLGGQLPLVPHGPSIARYDSRR